MLRQRVQDASWNNDQNPADDEASPDEGGEDDTTKKGKKKREKKKKKDKGTNKQDGGRRTTFVGKVQNFFQNLIGKKPGPEEKPEEDPTKDETESEKRRRIENAKELITFEKAQSNLNDCEKRKLKLRKWGIMVAIALCELANSYGRECHNAISDTLEHDLDISASELLILEILCLILACICGPISTSLLDSFGFRRVLFSFAMLNGLGASFKCMASYLFLYKSFGCFLFHAGHALQSIPQFVFISAAPRCAAIWFPPCSRAAADTLGAIAIPVGMVLSILMPSILSHLGIAVQNTYLVSVFLAIGSLLAIHYFIRHSRPYYCPAKSCPVYLVKETMKWDFKPLRDLGKEFIKNHDLKILIVVNATTVSMYVFLMQIVASYMCELGYNETYVNIITTIYSLVGFVGASCICTFIDATNTVAASTRFVTAWAQTSIALFIAFCSINITAASTGVEILAQFFIAVFLFIYGFFGFSQWMIFEELSIEITFPLPPATATILPQIATESIGKIYYWMKGWWAMSPPAIAREFRCEWAGNQRVAGNTNTVQMYSLLMLMIGMACISTIIFIVFFRGSLRRQRFEHAKLKVSKPTEVQAKQQKRKARDEKIKRLRDIKSKSKSMAGLKSLAALKSTKSIQSKKSIKDADISLLSSEESTSSEEKSEFEEFGEHDAKLLEELHDLSISEAPRNF